MRRLQSLESAITAALAEGVSTYSRVQATVIGMDGTEEVYKKFSVAIRADLNTRELMKTLRGNEEVKQVGIVQKEDKGDEPDYVAHECNIL